MNELKRYLNDTPPKLVRRLPQKAAQLRQCHQNCRDYVQWATSQGLGYKHVLGWAYRPEDRSYLAHSVVDAGSYYMCITPLFTAEKFILFTADPALSFVDAGDGFYDIHRNGIICPTEIAQW